MDTASAAQFLDVLGVDDLEFEPELFEHLDTPFFLKRCRTGDKHGSRTVAQQHFLNDEPGFDRFAQPHVVRDQQISAGHFNGAHQRIELKILDADAAAKGGLQKPSISVRRGAPSDSIQKRFERVGFIPPRYAR